jgi:putative transcriptional regulator
MNRIKEQLKKQGRTQQWLAEKVGKSYVVFTNYCNNKTQPSLKTLLKIAEILDVPVADLIVETDDQTGPMQSQQ